MINKFCELKAVSTLKMKIIQVQEIQRTSALQFKLLELLTKTNVILHKMVVVYTQENSGIWFELQVSDFNIRTMTAIFLSFGNDYHPIWPTM